MIQFLNILKKNEAIMNNPPFSVVNTDLEAPEPSTPGPFLPGRLPLALPNGNIVGLGQTEIAKTWRIHEQTVKSFWKMRRDTYIVMLRSAKKHLNTPGRTTVLKEGW